MESLFGIIYNKEVIYRHRGDITDKLYHLYARKRIMDWLLVGGLEQGRGKMLCSPSSNRKLVGRCAAFPDREGLT